MNITLGFLLTMISGLSTLIGIIPIFLNIKNINKFISFSLSFSSGVMFSISLFDLLPESINSFSNNYNLMVSLFLFIFLFFVGFLLTQLINKKVNTSNKLYKVGISYFIKALLSTCAFIGIDILMN